MFNVTRITASATKLARKTVKNVAKENINLSKASDSIKELHDEFVQIAPYSKNIFKRMTAWVKTFIGTYKHVKNELNACLEKKKNELGELFTKKDKKAAKKSFFTAFGEEIKLFKEELKTLSPEGKRQTK